MKDKPANYNGQTQLHEQPKLILKAWTRDRSSLAEEHIRWCPEGGYFIAKSRPPESIAKKQEEINGYDPVKFFDPNNQAKKVEGITKPAPSFGMIDREIINQEQVAEYLKIHTEMKQGVPTRQFNHVTKEIKP